MRFYCYLVFYHFRVTQFKFSESMNILHGLGRRSRANGRSFGTPWKPLDIGQVEGDLRIFPVVNSHVVYSLTGWNVPFSRLAPRSGFKWDDRK